MFLSLIWNHTYVTHECTHLWMYQDGYTPLMYAARNGHLRTVEYLLEKGADMTVKNEVSEQLNTDILFTTLIWHCREESMHYTLLARAAPNLTKRWRLSQHCWSMVHQQWCRPRIRHEPLSRDVMQHFVLFEIWMVCRTAWHRCKHLPDGTLGVTKLDWWKYFRRLNSSLLWAWGILLKWGTWLSAKERMSTREIM